MTEKKNMEEYNSLKSLNEEIARLKVDKERMAEANKKQAENSTRVIASMQEIIDGVMEKSKFLEEKLKDDAGNLHEFPTFQITGLAFANKLIEDEIDKIFFSHRVNRIDGSYDLVAVKNTMLDLIKFNSELIKSATGSGRLIGMSKSNMTRIFCGLVTKEIDKLQRQINVSAVTDTFKG